MIYFCAQVKQAGGDEEASVAAVDAALSEVGEGLRQAGVGDLAVVLRGRSGNLPRSVVTV
jgi:hypothetical protein